MTSNELEIFKQSILDDVRVMMQTTGQVTQYIGARYVPLFADPLDWSDQREYEPLTIVINQGNSYTSRQFVPKGTPISNEKFWVLTGNFNAQIEQYRNEVKALKTSVSAMQGEITSIKTELATPAKNKYGFAIALMEPFASQESIQTRIDNAYTAGAAQVNICVYVGESSMTTPVSLAKYAFSYAKSKGLGYSIKFHNVTTDANQYNSVVTQFLSDVNYDGEVVILYNEPDKSYFISNADIMIATIKNVHNMGYKVAISNKFESVVYGKRVNDACDIFGINMYPSMGFSMTYDIEEMSEKLSEYYRKMTANINQHIWVTETGILPKKCFLFNPEQYEDDKGYPANNNIGRNVDYNVPISYYKAAINTLATACDMVILWYTETSLTKEVAEYVKEH